MNLSDCTCGTCNPTTDRNGNVDYGNRWNGHTYVVRNCPVARLANEHGTSINALVVEGYLTRA